MSSPSRSVKIEFQGGEPLLNLGLIEWIVARAREMAAPAKKEVTFVIASNLALLTDDILSFCKANGVLLSTSLDGPRDLHNNNRPRPGGNSYELAVAGIRRAQQDLGKDGVGALMTTTASSLDRVEEIIDEYIALDLVVARQVIDKDPSGTTGNDYGMRGYPSSEELLNWVRSLTVEGAFKELDVRVDKDVASGSSFVSDENSPEHRAIVTRFGSEVLFVEMEGAGGFHQICAPAQGPQSNLWPC